MEIEKKLNKTNYDESLQEAQNLEELTRRILVIYPWFMAIWATVSNTLSFIVFTRPKLKKSSTFFYLSCLCVSDLIQVYTFCINFIIQYQFNIEPQLESVVYCKIFAFFVYFLPQFSACTCAAVSVDRVVCVLFSVPSKYQRLAKNYNTPDRALKIMMLIFSLLFILNFPFFFFPNTLEEASSNQTSEFIIKEINIIYCSFENGKHFKDYLIYWTLVDLSINVLIPFTIMIVCSVIIVIGIVHSTKNISSVKAKKLKNQSEPFISRLKTASFKNKGNFLKVENFSVRFKTIKENRTPVQSDPTSQISFSRRFSSTMYSTVSSKARNVSAMLTINNFVFISLTLPIVVCLYRISEKGFENFDPRGKAKVNLIKTVCIILMNTNCTVNIFVYSLMASEFRRHLLVLLKSCIFFRSLSTPNSSTTKPSSKSNKSNKNNFYLSNGDKIETTAIKSSEG